MQMGEQNEEEKDLVSSDGDGLNRGGSFCFSITVLSLFCPLSTTSLPLAPLDHFPTRLFL